MEGRWGEAGGPPVQVTPGPAHLSGLRLGWLNPHSCFFATAFSRSLLANPTFCFDNVLDVWLVGAGDDCEGMGCGQGAGWPSVPGVPEAALHSRLGQGESAPRGGQVILLGCAGSCFPDVGWGLSASLAIFSVSTGAESLA